jgi:hypothetical protein
LLGGAALAACVLLAIGPPRAAARKHILLTVAVGSDYLVNYYTLNYA